MYRFKIEGIKDPHEFEELIKIFLRPDEYEMSSGGKTFLVGEDKNLTKQEIFRYLEKEVGISPEWGIITGIRPVKLFGTLSEPDGDVTRAEKIFREYYLVSEEKTNLTREIYEYQQHLFGEATGDSAGIYIGIPFCPTRCLYCSFASNPEDDEAIKEYLAALHREIAACKDMMVQQGWKAESLYVGGGTPTTLSPAQLKELLAAAKDAFGGEGLKEFTVEAGRPDTVTSERMEVLKEAGVGRISINPQTMKDETLKRIGRDHTAGQVTEAFAVARAAGFDNINADIIAGLPGEDLEDFRDSIEKVLKLGAENVTANSLAVKRTSRLKEENENYHYDKGSLVRAMLSEAESALRSEGYRPYYLYRQKHMSGALENVGYCKDNKGGLYNARIMDEHQRIIALGAGGIGKAYDPVTRTLTRVPNVTNQEIYVERIDEMIKRKEQYYAY